MSASTPLNSSGRPRIVVDGARSEKLETDLIRLEARADAACVASLEAVFLHRGSRERGQPVDYVHFRRSTVDFGKRLRIAFNVDGEKFEKRFDIRYVPTNDVNEFTEFCEKYVESYRAGKVAEQDQSAVSDEIKALV